eukprot:8901551-Heterocapsa_arctica.AAC.1
MMRQLEMNENDYHNLVREYPNLDDEPDTEYTNSNDNTTASHGSGIIDDEPDIIDDESETDNDIDFLKQYM